MTNYSQSLFMISQYSGSGLILLLANVLRLVVYGISIYENSVK